MNGNQPDATSARPPVIFWPLLAVGIALSAFGAATGVLHLFWRLPLYRPSVLELDATLAALMVGLPAWYWYIVLPRRATLSRGIMVGAVGSLLAYPVMWVFAALNGRQAVFGAGDILASIETYTIWSWVYVGWLTTPVGALAGGLLVSLQHVLTSAGQAHPSDSRGAATTQDDTPYPPPTRTVAGSLSHNTLATAAMFTGIVIVGFELIFWPLASTALINFQRHEVITTMSLNELLILINNVYVLINLGGGILVVSLGFSSLQRGRSLPSSWSRHDQSVIGVVLGGVLLATDVGTFFQYLAEFFLPFPFIK